jgi:predicted DNA-binding ribbon-helix-helix protein
MSSRIIPVTSTVKTVISSIINNHTSVTIEQQLADHLDSIPTTEQLAEVQNLLLAISEADTSVAEIASKVWMYVMAHKL